MKELGIIDDENKVEEGDILRYLELFKTPLAPSHVQALCNIPTPVAPELGIIDDENKVEEGDILRYLELFKTPLAPSHVQALCNIPTPVAPGA
ncbi:hypothetical protein E2562_028270 [Oryza meyeriana var. granulata]|uniref:Uncharacterized protein n=1 Tax=Oryza meyeriana var. granulata TaxID=110450 RepID=A0A6G1E2V4_9ORYZ|nr:hypothetical protein E2562_028270 [Oryza meyeriana var. granulata]